MKCKMVTRVFKNFFLTALFAVISQFSSAQSINNADTVPDSAKEKRAALLTPKYYTNWIGASFFTIPTIEKDCDVRPVRIIGLTFFYDFGSCFVGMKSNTTGVIVQITLRLYGDSATEFLKKARDYGYSYSSKGNNVTVRGNKKIISDVYETTVGTYRKVTKNGTVILEVSTSEEFAGEYEISLYRSLK